MQLVECVPNFSEGRDRAVIDEIAAGINSAAGVDLLDVSAGADANRTVITFVGSPDAVLDGAFRGIAKAAARIDMTKHHGAHARLGACDVCPFVPLQDISMDECVDLARRLGRRVADELSVPVYLYENAASNPERRNLATLRAGEYEGLRKKLTDPRWQPDFGEAQFNAKSGATAIGARDLLIAINFDLDTRDCALAHDIACQIRESGCLTKDNCGAIVGDDRCQPVRQLGAFKFVKAIGWYMECFEHAQVSVNLTNYRATPLSAVFDEVCRLAEERGARCIGSELIGLIPRESLLEAGRHFRHKAGKTAPVAEPELIRSAVSGLLLDALHPFSPDKKIIEYCIECVREV